MNQPNQSNQPNQHRHDLVGTATLGALGGAEIMAAPKIFSALKLRSPIAKGIGAVGLTLATDYAGVRLARRINNNLDNKNSNMQKAAGINLGASPMGMKASGLVTKAMGMIKSPLGKKIGMGVGLTGAGVLAHRVMSRQSDSAKNPDSYAHS